MNQAQDIRFYMLLRLLMLFSILFSIVLYQRSGILNESIILKTYLMIFLTFLFTSILIFLYEHAKKIRSLLIGQITYDLAFTTLLISYTGPYESIYIVFYLFNIIFAGILFSVKGGLLAAFASSIFYSSILWLHTRSLSHENFFSLLTTLMAFITIAVLSGQFMEELNRSRSQVNQEVKEKTKLQEKLSDIRGLAGGVAHAILNPIASISGAAQLLSDPATNKQEKDNLIKMIIRESERVDRLIAQLLQFSKPSVLKKEPILLHKVIQDCVKTVETRSDFKDLQVKISIDIAQPLIVYGSTDQLSEVFTNLLVNSMQAFMIQKNNATQYVHIWGTKIKKQVEMIIEDNGPGIDPQVQDHIFDPFFTTKSTGIGLGLAQVYKIIKEHHGNIKVETKEGIGTKFIINLPT